jgi:hypothetical protein
MKKLLLMAFATAALAACNGPRTEPAAAPATAAATVNKTAAVAGSDAIRADAKAAEVATTIGSVLRGGDPNAHYVLGEALPLHYVHGSALAACGGNCAPEALIGEAVDRIYPVSLDGQFVGSVTLHKVDGEWQVAAIGQGAASGKLAEARAELRRGVAADDNAFAVVQVIGPNVRLLAHREQAALKLTSLVKGESLAPRAAADVFADLAARAQ